MKTRNTFSISFFLKKDKNKVKNGFAPLYARITVNGDFKDLATKRKVEISSWNQREQKLSGKADEHISVREKIRLLTNVYISVKLATIFRSKLATPKETIAF